MCKKTIVSAVSEVEGVKWVTLDVKTKVLTASYFPEETTAEAIKAAIANSGYNADDIKANQDAFNNLHGCCKAPHD